MKPALKIRVNRALRAARAVIRDDTRGKSGAKLRSKAPEEVKEGFSH